MSAAQRDLLTPIEYPAAFPAVFPAETEAEIETQAEAEAPFALKQQVAQRLAAHRARRTHPSGPASVPVIAKPDPAKARSARIAATVAERYANSPSYRAFLAAEAENAIRAAQAASREAEAAAEIAAISAKAVADAQYELLAELDHWTLTAPPPPTPEPAPAASFPNQILPSPAPRIQSALPSSTHGLTVRLYDDPTRSTPMPASNHIQPWEPLDEAEGIALDEEIAFRQSPTFEDYTSASELPANLIEFPRQLVAARRARPRLAEGPLREDLSPTPDAAQLRIFEVEASQISTAPSAGSAYSLDFPYSPHSTEPEWSSILLAAHPVSSAGASAEALLNPIFAAQFFPQPAPQPAPLNLRLMATLVDACILATAFLAFVAAFAITSGKVSARLYPTQPLPAIASLTSLQTVAPLTVAIAALATLAIFALLYQLLFFTFSEATPGMRYARIGLCTFSDENPTRRNMRRRLFAVLLAACPLGIGFLWAWLDEEGLGWHDRLSRMYQRSY